MADLEVKLPRASSQDRNPFTNSKTVNDEKEKLDQNDSASNLGIDEFVGPNDQIVWHYLTFETELPPAYLAQPLAILDTKSQPPICPDLNKYTSPFIWPKSRKSYMTWLGFAATTITAYTPGSYAAGIEQMTREWHISDSAFSVGITTFTCGFAAAPMFLAPFSEINGRRPIFLITGVLFVLFQLTCALTPTFAGMLVARFIVGCSCSTFSTVVGGVIADYYHAKERNTSMAIFAGGAFLGTGLGPLVSGFVAQNLNWRWIFYIQVMTCGALLVVIVLTFKETRGSVLLSRKAKALNSWYEQLECLGYYGVKMPTVANIQTLASPHDSSSVPQRIRWKVKSDEERGSIFQMISISLYRPFHLLFTEPVVFFFSLWISFSWAILYLQFSAIPLVFQANYGFNTEQSGAVFIAISIGSLFSTLISVYQEPLARRYLAQKHQKFLSTPEGRLMFCCAQSALCPIGLFWFAWTQFGSIPWIVPTIAIVCFTMGIFSVYLAVFNYLADIYGRYASSTLAAQSFCRNMLAGAFPIFTPQMFHALTFQGAGSFLGGVAALLTVVPWVLVFYGPKIRARSKFARELVVNTE